MIKLAMIGAIMLIGQTAHADELTKTERQYVTIGAASSLASAKCGFEPSTSSKAYFEGFGITKTRRDQLGAAILQGLSNHLGIPTDPEKEIREVNQIVAQGIIELDHDIRADRHETCTRWRKLLANTGLIQ
jgi:hypothetical protein